MHLIRRPSTARRLSLCLALVLASATSHADDAAAAVPPPAFPDAEHAPNGCHLSTLAYLARFRAEFPRESAEVLILSLRNKDGVHRPHTLALVSWRGEWWGRDEYFGVFRVGVELDRDLARERLHLRVTGAFVRHSAKAAATAAYRRPPVPVGSMSPDDLARAETTALRVVPFPGTAYRVSLGEREFPLIFFRPDEKTVAVYDPHRGTCLAETDCRDDLAVVAAIAGRLGYRGDSARAALPAATALVALAR